MSNVEATSEIFLRSSAPINPAAANCAGVLNVADFISVVSSLVFTFHKPNQPSYCALCPKRVGTGQGCSLCGPAQACSTLTFREIRYTKPSGARTVSKRLQYDARSIRPL